MAVFHCGARFQICGCTTMHVRSTGLAIIRAVNTVDAMTATIEPVDWPIPNEDYRPYSQGSETVNRAFVMICLRNPMRLSSGSEIDQ